MRLPSLLYLLLTAALLVGQTAPEKNFSRTTLKVEGSYLNNFLGNNLSKSSGLDLHLGLERSKSLNDKISFDYGLGLGFTANKLNYAFPTDGVLFVSNFRNQDTHYFTIDQVRQLNLNIPLSFAYLLKAGERWNTSLVAGINTQINILSSFDGIGLDDEENRFFNQLNRSEATFDTGINLLNDFRPNLGISWSVPSSSGTLDVGLGFEYSYFGRMLGAYGKVAYSFGFKK